MAKIASAKFGVLIYLPRYRTHLDIVPTNIGSTEVAPGWFLDFCLRFPYNVKIIKIKSSSWTKLFTPHERASKTERNDTFPVPIRHISHEIQPIKNEKARCACAGHKMPIRT